MVLVWGKAIYDQKGEVLYFVLSISISDKIVRNTDFVWGTSVY
jgi:hypothetical protein